MASVSKIPVRKPENENRILFDQAAIVEIHAVSLAPSLALRDLQRHWATLPSHLTRKRLVVHVGDESVLICFDFGTVVFVGHSPAERDATLAEMSALLDIHDDIPSYDEAIRIHVDPDTEMPPRVDFDRITMPQLSLSSTLIISRLLAQSAAVERFEVNLDQLLAQLEILTQDMAKTGRIRVSERRVVRMAARSITSNNRILGALALLDKPELAWNSRSNDHLHEEFHQQLELTDRFQTLEYKLRAIHDTVTLVLDTMQTRRALVLEATIVLLFVLEIVLAFM